MWNGRNEVTVKRVSSWRAAGWKSGPGRNSKSFTNTLLQSEVV
jgi:hypothetical protein